MKKAAMPRKFSNWLRPGHATVFDRTLATFGFRSPEAILQPCSRFAPCRTKMHFGRGLFWEFMGASQQVMLLGSSQSSPDGKNDSVA